VTGPKFLYRSPERVTWARSRLDRPRQDHGAIQVDLRRLKIGPGFSPDSIGKTPERRFGRKDIGRIASSHFDIGPQLVAYLEGLEVQPGEFLRGFLTYNLFKGVGRTNAGPGDKSA